MKELQKVIKNIISDLQNNINNEKDLDYAKTKLFELYTAFADELEEIETSCNKKVDVIGARYSILEAKINEIENELSKIEKDIYIDENEEVISLTIVNKECQLVAITENGYGKRTMSSEFRLTSRGSKGVKAGQFNEKTGKLVSMLKVKDDQDLLLMSDNGVVIRVAAKDISLLSRATQGVKIMKLKEGSKIVSVAIGEHEEEEAPIVPEDLVVEQIKNEENKQ